MSTKWRIDDNLENMTASRRPYYPALTGRMGRRMRVFLTKGNPYGFNY